jgi:hypothetical protein
LLVTFKVELPAPLEARAIVAGLRFALGPEGETEADRLMVPEYPLKLDRLMVEVPDLPWTMVRVVGLAPMEKSGDGGFVTVTETLAE